MQIVIEMTEDDFKKVQDGRAPVTVMRNAIRNGKVLPKGHGRIVDIDNAVKDMESVNKSFWTFYAKGCEPAVDYIGEVLIEADKEEEDA